LMFLMESAEMLSSAAIAAVFVVMGPTIASQARLAIYLLRFFLPALRR
jgi:hypothetical protein